MGQAAQAEDQMAETVEEEREVVVREMATRVGATAEALQEVAWMVAAAVVDMGAEARAVVVRVAAWTVAENWAVEEKEAAVALAALRADSDSLACAEGALVVAARALVATATAAVEAVEQVVAEAAMVVAATVEAAWGEARGAREVVAGMALAVKAARWEVEEMAAVATARVAMAMVAEE